MRDDFFYRLCSNIIELPSLRMRLAESPGELRDLVTHLCARIAGERPSSPSEVSGAHRARPGPRTTPFPGNVRELEQCVRRVLLTGALRACAATRRQRQRRPSALSARIERGELAADAAGRRYCEHLLYAREQSYVEVARITGLDRRTVRRHLTSVAARGTSARERKSGE